MFNNNDIIITDNKKEILINNKELKYIKVYSLNEFLREFYFKYDLNTIKYIIDKYNVIYDIALIYLDNLYYIDNKKYKSNKLNFLLKLKKELLSNNLLICNKLFKEYIKGKNIIIYNLEITKEIQLLIDELNKICNVKIINEDINNYNHTIYELNTLEDEVLYVATEIIKLINEGIDINKIYLGNLDNEYRKDIKRLFPMFNIPFSLDNDESIYGTYLVTEFINHFEDDLDTNLSHLQELIDTEEEISIYKEIVKIVNNSIHEDKELLLQKIKHDLKINKIPSLSFTNSIKEYNLSNNLKDDEYLFLLSFNQGIIPSIYKDEEYLSDIDREELNISLTKDKNNLSSLRIKKYLNNNKNIIITYKLYANGEEYHISNINEELNYNIINNISIPYIYSNKYNKIYLTSLIDNYNKYGTTKDDLYLLNDNYNDIPYKSYNHSYKGINSKDLKDYLSNELTLSYSSMNNYYKCPFSYYIENILKLNIYEETFYQTIGNIFHSILEKYNTNDLDILWEEEINNLNRELTNKEKFFLNKLKKELEFVIETLKYQETLTNLHEELHEEKIYISNSKNTKVIFKGFVDKIKYKKDNDKTILAIIDYKTGNTDIDLSLLPYGLSMQLPVYLYLAKRSKKFNNVEIAGFYIQKILNNEITVDKDSTYQQEKRKNLLLQGYSNSDINILSELDTSFENSELIKGLRLKKDGSFYSYSKVLSKENMNTIDEIVDEKIKECTNNIFDAKFSIAPKKIENKNYGCSYCKYSDICYKKNDDIVELKKLDIEKDILGGDENGVD